MKDAFHFIVPEWRRLDRLEKERARTAAGRALGWRRWTPILAVPLMAALPLVKYPFSPIFMFPVGVLLPLLFVAVYRTALRRACWVILAERGEPICVACGYNLTGNVSGRCPECGQVHRDL